MKRFILLLFIYQTISVAQSSSVFIDNFSGIESAQYNPANIADSFYKIDITLFSSSVSMGTNFASINPFKILGDINLKADDDFGIQEFDTYVNKRDNSTSSNIYANGTVLGPSVLYTIDRNQAIGFTTAVKFNASGVDINTQLFDLLNKNTFLKNLNSLENLRNKDFKGFANIVSWAELGLTYARVLKLTSSEMIKVGGSLKFLRGLKNYAISLEKFNIVTDLNFDNTQESTVQINGEVLVNNSLASTNFGQGLDIGIVYEKRKNTLPHSSLDKQGVYYAKAPYTYKLTASITDIGSISFDKVETSVNIVDLNLPRNIIGNINRFMNISNPLETTSKVIYTLPTTLHLNADFNIKNHYYINTNLDYFLLSNKKPKVLKTVSNISITPRYESYKFSAFMPITLNRLGVFKWGFGFRTPYFYMGSSSMFTNLTNFSKEGDIYIGVKIPVYNKRTVKEFKKSLEHHKIY